MKMAGCEVDGVYTPCADCGLKDDEKGCRNLRSNYDAVIKYDE